MIRNTAKQLLGPDWTTRLRCLWRGHPLPRWGNLRRTRPFSSHFGFERGTPVDRHYLHAFLARHAGDIRGDVLEVQSSDYTRRFGSRLLRVESFDIVPGATYTCDLARSEGVIASDAWDCLLMPATLSVLKDVDECLRQALRIVRPGGVILASAAGLVPLTADMPDYWHLSAEGWREKCARLWPGCELLIEGHGNCLSATASMMGLALEELTAAELDAHDPRYPVVVTLRCRKPR